MQFNSVTAFGSPGEALALNGAIDAQNQAYRTNNPEVGERSLSCNNSSQYWLLFLNYAVLLYTQEAIRLYRQALEAKLRSVGEHHISTGISLNSLGAELKKVGRYEEAKGYLERALEVRENLPGPKLDVLVSRDELACI